MTPQPPPPENKLIKTTRRVIPLVFVLFFVLVATVFSAILLPFVLALFVAYIFAPAVSSLSDPKGRFRFLHLPRWGAVLAVYGIFFGSVGLFGAIVLPKLGYEIATLPGAVGDFAKTAQAKAKDEWLPSLKEQIRKYLPAPETQPDVPQPSKPPKPLPERPILRVTPGPEGTAELDLSALTLEITQGDDGHFRVQAVSPRPPTKAPEDPADAVLEGLQSSLEDAPSHVGDLVSQLLSLVQRLLSGIVSAIVSLVLMFMIAAFLMVGLDDIFDFLRKLVPHEYRDGYDDLLRRLDRSLQGVIRGQLKICLVNGILSAIGFIMIGLKFSIILAVFAAIMSMIPIFGSILSSIPAVAIAFAQASEGPEDYSGIVRAALVLGWILLIHAIEANVLNPKIMGDSAKINPILVVLALVIGEHWFGLVGALLAVPAFSILQTLFVFAMIKTHMMKEDEEKKSPKQGWMIRLWRRMRKTEEQPPSPKLLPSKEPAIEASNNQ